MLERACHTQEMFFFYKKDKSLFWAFKTCKNYTKTKELCLTFKVQWKNHAWVACHTLSLSCHKLLDALYKAAVIKETKWKVAASGRRNSDSD